jgi:hypothetical protein
MSQHGRAQIAIRKGHRVAWTKGYIVKNAAIFSQRDFAFRAAIQIIENHSGQPPLRYAPQIIDIHDMRRVDGRHADRLHTVSGAEIIKPQFRSFRILRARPMALVFRGRNSSRSVPVQLWIFSFWRPLYTKDWKKRLE